MKQDVELTAADLKELANQFKAEYKAKIGEDFPDDPKEQLMGAIKAVFRSWDNPRANVYRRDNDIPYSWGTAVNVQSMAFGNMGDDCGTGVAFTRDPHANAYFRDGGQVPRGIHSVQGGLQYPGEALQRYAGYGVYSRARQALYAADT